MEAITVSCGGYGFLITREEIIDGLAMECFARRLEQLLTILSRAEGAN